METGFVYKMREILTMRQVSGRWSLKCGSLPRDAGDLVGLLTMHLMITMWSTGRPLHFWTENPTKVLDGSKKQHIFRKRDDESLKRDEGSYMLSHMYDRFLATSHLSHGKNRKKNRTSFFWWRSLVTDRNVQVKMFGCVEVIVSLLKQIFHGPDELHVPN